MLKSFNFLTFLAVTILLMPISQIEAAEVDISALKNRCDSLTDQQRQLAATAGFDIDSLCSKLENTQSTDINKRDLRTERATAGDEALLDNNALPTSRGSELNSDDEEFLKVLGMANEFKNTDEEEQKEIDEQDVELEKYGYNLFSGSPTTFAPVTELPVPVNYVLGVGDTVQVQLLGKVDSNYELKINRDGNIQFPEIGPINLSGLEYSEAKKIISHKVSSHKIGVTAHVTLGELRSIGIFVLGEASTPGSYTVSSLSTMTNAIFVSGGVTEIASLRNIQLKRKGKLITTLDLYDLLQKGDTSGDVNLLPGDVIYIPTVDKTVEVNGEINRPAIYEIKKGETLADLIKIAGGFSANSFPNSSYIERNNQQGFRTIVDVDLTSKKALKESIYSGDSLMVGSILETVEDVVKLTGHFNREKQIKWRKGLRVSNVITSVIDFKESPELGIALIIRKKMPLRKISILDFDVEKMLANPLGDNDLLLEPLDEIIVFGASPEVMESDIDGLDLSDNEQLRKLFSSSFSDELKSEREKILEPILEQITQQATDGHLANIVYVNGNVKFPGTYPMSKSMSVKDLVLLAGGLEEATYLGSVEISRRDLTDIEKAVTNHLNVSLLEQLKEEKTFQLNAKDVVTIYGAPEYRDDLAIELEGEVRFPGSYIFKQGETLSQVIERAGGFTDAAHQEAAILTRVDLRLQEEIQLNNLRERLKRDIVASELEEKAAGKSSAVGQAEDLLNTLGEVEAIGRLVIDLPKIMLGSITDIQLKSGDLLIIPPFRQEVSVLGEVQHATSHLFNKEWILEDYLERSGGLTKRADDERIYVVRADGSVFLPNQGGWLSHQNKMLQPGDTIVIPQDTDRIKSLTLFTSISQVVYQLSLGAAAIINLTRNSRN